MNLLVNNAELSQRKSEDQIPLKCEQCQKTFFRKKHHIQTILKSNLSKGKYCSEKCKGLARRKRTAGQCKQCETPIIIKPYMLTRGKYQFCSKSCKCSYWNAHKTWGSTRSKLEKWIEEELTKKYPNLHIDYNKTDAISAELDIYIPSLKLAFELNGIFHYEPIFGEKKLGETKTTDKGKFVACAEREIGLCVIDTHHSKYLKKERDQKFLSIITDIIDPLL